MRQFRHRDSVWSNGTQRASVIANGDLNPGFTSSSLTLCTSLLAGGVPYLHTGGGSALQYRPTPSGDWYTPLGHFLIQGKRSNHLLHPDVGGGGSSEQPMSGVLLNQILLLLYYTRCWHTRHYNDDQTLPCPFTLSAIGIFLKEAQPSFLMASSFLGYWLGLIVHL